MEHNNFTTVVVCANLELMPKKILGFISSILIILVQLFYPALVLADSNAPNCSTILSKSTTSFYQTLDFGNLYLTLNDTAFNQYHDSSNPYYIRMKIGFGRSPGDLDVYTSDPARIDSKDFKITLSPSGIGPYS